MNGRDECPADRCRGCWYYSPRQGGHDPVIMDLRTGHRYCHECAAALITWELDGRPEADTIPIAEWSGLEVEQ